MKKNEFLSLMITHGDTRRTLAKALAISAQTIGDKINGRSDFKQSEIMAIIERYNLTPGQVDKIFFEDSEPWTDL